MRTGGKLNICPLCVDEQADPKSPRYKDADHRGKPPIPCPEHGDPRILYPENKEAVSIYDRLRQHHFIKQYETGGQTHNVTHYDVMVAIALCRAYGVADIPDTLEKIDVIHKELYE